MTTDGPDGTAEARGTGRIRRWLAPLETLDLQVALVATLVAELVYFFTAAPSITFLDSGELVMAAAGFGVPHPTGYPLWTFLAWLFTLLPLGHTAWEVNLFSGVCAALATGIVAGLLCHASRRLGVGPWAARILAFGLSLCFALTASVWSQAVFAEVYTLHVLMVAILVLVLYRWLLDPAWERGFLTAVFVLSVGMTNHHLVLAVAPLPLLVALLVRPRLAAELTAYCAGAGAVVYIAFGSLSAEASMQETALRSGQLAIALLVSVILLRHRLRAWKTGLLILPIVAIGLLPYVYLPLASSTNPPMNWGYTQTADGFFYSVNRTPYQSPFSAQLQDTVGRLVGTGATPEVPGKREWDPSKTFPEYLRNYRDSLHDSFTPLVWWLLAVALAMAWKLRRSTGPWIVVLGVGIVLSALLQASTSAKVDAGGLPWLDWRLQMPYLGYSYIFGTLLAGLGAAMTWKWLNERSRPLGSLALAVATALPLLAFGNNRELCSQRGHDFARRFGHDMLSEMPPGSVLFGGTDAGRFVPTWMILGESLEPTRHRYDPDFDRRDLYIITQPQLPARFYHYYIRDHYGADRPEPGWFGRWLGRDEQYPQKTLQLPSDDELREIVRGLGAGVDLRTLTHATAAWIFHNNKDEHPFFIEESRIMPWAIPHAVPAGPRIRLEPEPVATYDEATLEVDRAYWRRTIAELMADEDFLHDSEARLPFSSLRRMGGDLYRSRNLYNEAEAAFRQALELKPGEVAASISLADLLYSRGRAEEALEHLEGLRDRPVLQEMKERYEQADRGQKKRWSEHAQLLVRPMNPPVMKSLLETYPEQSSGVVVNIVEDLRGFSASLSNPVVLRRLLANYRSLEEDAVAAAVGRRAIAEGGEHQRAVLRLLLAFQAIQAEWDDESEELRRELGRRLVALGEYRAARDVLALGRAWGQDRSELTEPCDRLAAEDEALTPLLDQIRRDGATNETAQKLLETLAEGELGTLRRQTGDLGPAVLRLVRALGSWDASRPDPSLLAELVDSYRRLRLPGRGREVLRRLARSEALDPEVVDAAVRLATSDLLPSELTTLVDLQARHVATRPRSLVARAGFQFALNDQDGLVQTLGLLRQLVDAPTLLGMMAADPNLRLLAEDYRFRRFLIQNLS